MSALLGGEARVFVMTFGVDYSTRGRPNKRWLWEMEVRARSEEGARSAAQRLAAVFFMNGAGTFTVAEKENAP